MKRVVVLSRLAAIERRSGLIQSEGDLVRLRRALAMKRIITLNGGDEQLSLKNFRVGRVLMVPDFKPEHVHVVDADVARLFFHSEDYYGATIQKLEDSMRALDQALRDPNVRTLLSE